MTLKESEVIQLALDKYLSTENQWCKGAVARLNTGLEFLHPESSKVVSRCVMGAITAALKELHGAIVPLPIEMDELVVHFAAENPHLRIITKEGKKAVIDAGGFLPNPPVTHIRAPINVPEFNDHPLMTYQGVRTVMEKYLAALQEEGR